MNYRHAFHAGNFADLIKHAAATLILDHLLAIPGPLLVLDSHAGAGLYDLRGEMARKSKEAEAGVARLMADDDAPEAFDALKADVRDLNRQGGLDVYPGSPVLVARRLRRDDEYIGAELRSDDFAALSEALAQSRGRAQAIHSDGFSLIEQRAQDSRRLFFLIDPPFEDPDDYGRIAKVMAPVLRRKRPTMGLIWLPLEDLETFDSFLRRLEALEPPSLLVVETRLQPLHDPMRMNGCALVLLGAPQGLEAPLQAAAEWIVRQAGGPGGQAKLWRLGG